MNNLDLDMSVAFSVSLACSLCTVVVLSFELNSFVKGMLTSPKSLARIVEKGRDL